MKKQITLTYHKISGKLVEQDKKGNEADDVATAVEKIRNQLADVFGNSDIPDGPITITIEAGK